MFLLQLMSVKPDICFYLPTVCHLLTAGSCAVSAAFSSSSSGLLFFYFVYLFFLLRFSFCRRLRRAVNEVNLALSHASLLLTFARRARSPLLTSVILRCCWPKRAKVPTSEAKRLRFKNKYIYSYIFLRFVERT